MQEFLQMVQPVISLIPLIGVFCLMLSMGLVLKARDFLLITKAPLPVAAGCLGQLVLLPVFAFLICLIFGLPSHIALGLMIIAACPGGATSNAFSVLVKGDFALSITLTAISSFVAFLTVPFVIGLSMDWFGYTEALIKLDFIDTAIRLLFTTALPIMIGMLLKLRFPDVCAKFIRPLYWLGFSALIVPSISFLFQFSSLLVHKDILPSLTAILLNGVMIFVGLCAGWLIGLPAKQGRTLAIEIGIQNFGLVLVIIVTFLQDLQLLLPAIMYLPAMFISAGLVAVISRLKFPKVSPAP